MTEYVLLAENPNTCVHVQGQAKGLIVYCCCGSPEHQKDVGEKAQFQVEFAALIELIRGLRQELHGWASGLRPRKGEDIPAAQVKSSPTGSPGHGNCPIRGKYGRFASWGIRIPR